MKSDLSAQSPQAAQPPGLLDQVLQTMRPKHMSLRTEDSLVYYIGSTSCSMTNATPGTWGPKRHVLS
jgi:hypothetical protein